MPATDYDFFGEGLDPTKQPAAPDAPTGYVPGAAAAANKLVTDATNNANINVNSDRNASVYVDPMREKAAYESGNTGGASGAYNMTSDAGRAGFDYMHDLGSPETMTDFINGMGERVGVSHAGDALGPSISSNPISALSGAAGELGTNVAPGPTGRPGESAKDIAPGAFDAMGDAGGIISGAVGDALGGLGGGGTAPFDSSGVDRGGMGLGGAYSDTLANAAAQGANARALGTDVLAGRTAAPNAADATRQGDALDQVMGYANGPRQANDVMGKVNAFAQGPEGPSKAQMLLDQASQGAMADVLAASRSGRARDAGSAARASNVAQGEIAGMGVDNARSAGLLRADEADKARSQTLQALGLQGNLAQGLDQNTLQALTAGGDLASQMRGAGIQERGQGLNFMQGQEGIGAGLTGDVLKTIPQLEQVRHSDQFALTPQQQLEQARLGGPPEKTTADYVTALLGDVLGVL